MRVGIVGAGTAGLAAATLFAREGHAVEVLERAPNPGPVARRRPRPARRCCARAEPATRQGANLALIDAAALVDAESLGAYEAARRAQARFYAFGARALNAVFQHDWDAMAWPRDRLMPVVAKVPWARRRMISVLTGRARGLFT